MDGVPAEAVKNLKCLFNKFNSLCYLFIALFVDLSSMLAFIPIYCLGFSWWTSADRISDSGVSYSPVIKFLDDRRSLLFRLANFLSSQMYSLPQGLPQILGFRGNLSFVHLSTDLCFVPWGIDFWSCLRNRS